MNSYSINSYVHLQEELGDEESLDKVEKMMPQKVLRNRNVQHEGVSLSYIC